jgi:hypothetical protein
MAECHPSKVDVAVRTRSPALAHKRIGERLEMKSIVSYIYHLSSFIFSGACSSTAEQRPHKALVAGSNPAGPIADCR